MQRNWLQRTWDDWRRRNRDRFQYPPYVVSRKFRGYQIWFDGITPEISLHMTPRGYANIHVSIRGGRGGVDLIAEELEMQYQRTSAGLWYCGYCENPEYFVSRKALWEGHTFSPLLQFMETNFQPDMLLCLFTEDPERGMREAQIVPESELHEQQKRGDFWRAIPVIKRSKQAV